MMANLSTAAAPLYVYQFNVDDDYNYAKKLYGVSLPSEDHSYPSDPGPEGPCGSDLFTLCRRNARG